MVWLPNDEPERVWKETAVAQSRNCRGSCLNEMKKTTELPSQVCRCQDRNLIPTPSEHKSVATPIMNGMVASIPRIPSALTCINIDLLASFPNILTLPQFRQIYSASFITNLSAVMVTRHQHIHLVFSAFTSRPTSFVGPTGASVFFLELFTFLSNNIFRIKEKLTCPIHPQFSYVILYLPNNIL
jgi:hypothetical protein